MPRSARLKPVLAPVAALCLALTWGGPAFAEKDCEGYAALAVTQSGEHGALGCLNGEDEWWRVDKDYHLKWCNADTTTEAMVNAGRDARANALNDCRETPSLRRSGTEADEAVSVGGAGAVMGGNDLAALATGPVSGTKVRTGGGGSGVLTEDGAVLVLGGGEIRLPCPLQFGDVTFRPEEVEGGIAKSLDGSSGMSAQCAYRGGQLRISANWMMPSPEGSAPASNGAPLGCWEEHMGTQDQVNDYGFSTKSDSFAAQASATGSGDLIKIARENSSAAVRGMLIVAELHGPMSCP